MFYALDFMWNSGREWGPIVEDGVSRGVGAGHGGALWDGKRGFCLERWGFWKERFGAIGLKADVDDNTKDWAEQAKRTMEEIQGAG